jgi:hypothetical protein
MVMEAAVVAVAVAVVVMDEAVVAVAEAAVLVMVDKKT